MTSALRAAPLQQFDGVVLGRVRRQVRLRLAPAAAAMAIAAVGLGSLVASTQFSRAPGIRPTEVAPAVVIPSDFALNGRRSDRLKAAPRDAHAPGPAGPPGPVLRSAPVTPTARAGTVLAMYASLISSYV